MLLHGDERQRRGRARLGSGATGGLGTASESAGAALSFEWTLRLRPASSSALLEPAGATVSLVADVPGVYAVDLVVGDGLASSPPATALVVATERGRELPIARAGDDAGAVVGDVVTLDGSGSSSEPPGTSLTFAWSILMQPAGSVAALVGADTVSPSFTPDAIGEYVVSLVVDDGTASSVPDVVRITVSMEPPPGGDLERGVFDPGEVYLAGTLSKGACYRDAIAHYSAPSTATVGFDCYFDSRKAVVSAGGTLLYVNTFEDALREFHCDSCPGWRVGDPYPEDVLANDTILPTPPCTSEGTTRLSGFLASPDGARAHSCSGVWYDATGTEIGRMITPLSYGWEGRLLLAGAAIFDIATGTSTPIATWPPSGCSVRVARAGASTGFRVALRCAAADELWSIAHDGTATREGTYPAPPPSYSPAHSAALTADGALIEFARGPMTFEDAIIRRTIGGASELVYTEEMTPPPGVLIHISDLVTGP